jgi:thiol-disulfide isomerase/thioredoxin
LAQDCESLELKTPIENFQLATFNKSKVDLKSIIKNKKAVIYFWSPEIMNQDMLIKRVKRLNEKHPSLLFVGVNMKPNNNTKIYKSLENQFILTKESTANKFLKSLEPRTILVDENGIITNNFTYLSSQHLEKQLDNLERK